MSDEQQPGGRAGGGGDQTGRFDPTADEQAGDRIEPGDTAAMPTPGDTAAMPTPGDTAAMPTPGDTAARPDETALLPPAGGAAPWAGRAAVRPPGSPGAGPIRTEWTTDEPPDGRWWMPILIGIVVLLLLALLGFGVWLIARNIGDDTPGPGASSVPAPSTTRPSTPPTTEPTTEEPEPTEEEPQEVAVPPVVGLTLEDAGEALDEAGLTYRIVFRASDEREGTVIGTNPRVGRQVPRDSEVTLFVAEEPEPEPEPTPTTSGTGDEAPALDEPQD